MIFEYFRIALRSLARRRMRSWLTLIGIVIGITSVVALIGLGQGLEAAITGIFGSLGTDKLTVQATGGFGPPGSGVIDPLTNTDVEKIRRINGVKSVAGRLIEAGKLEFNEKVAFGTAVSIPKAVDERRLIFETVDIEADEGRILRPTDNKKVMVGSGVGELEDFFGKDIVPGSKIKLQDTEFEVVAVLKSLGNFLFDNAVYMNEDDLREVFDLTADEQDVIAVQVDDEDNIKEIKADIEKYLRKARDVKMGEEDFSVASPEEALDSVSSTLGAVQMFVVVIAAISILVGGIGIMNTMFMSVTERTRDIGIMKSIGARNSTIFSLFFIESGLIGSIGGLLGAIMGTLLAVLGSMGLRNFLGGDIDVRAEIGVILFMGSVVGAFIVGSTFGIIPALRAAKMHPVEALRKKN